MGQERWSESRLYLFDKFKIFVDVVLRKCSSYVAGVRLANPVYSSIGAHTHTLKVLDI